MQDLDKLNLKINLIPNGLEKHMSFSINNKFNFTDSFQFLNSLLDSLVKILVKFDFKYLSQEFDNNLLDLVKQSVWAILKTLKNNYQAKKSFIVC